MCTVEGHHVEALPKMLTTLLGKMLNACFAAVAYKGRGCSGKDKHAAVDRNRAITIVADAAESAIRLCGGAVQVDLSNPQVHWLGSHHLIRGTFSMSLWTFCYLGFTKACFAKQSPLLLFLAPPTPLAPR